MGVEDEYFVEQEQLERDEQDAIEDGMANNGPPETRRSKAYWENEQRRRKRRKNTTAFSNGSLTRSDRDRPSAASPST
ncbi:MAG TPA: hypothetical protein VK638_40995 [Edaphobacter sp.]|nr:hypothetical protein [Edaphobacter sp.]